MGGYFHGGVMVMVMVMDYDNHTHTPEAICQSQTVIVGSNGYGSLHALDVSDLDPCWYSTISHDESSFDCSDKWNC